MNSLSCQGDQNVQSDQQGRRWDTEKHKSLFEVMEEPCHQGASLIFTPDQTGMCRKQPINFFFFRVLDFYVFGVFDLYLYFIIV